ncbi:MAG: hypothetical protein ACFCUN_14480 [Hyphomicrobiaceae bacterium]
MAKNASKRAAPKRALQRVERSTSTAQPHGDDTETGTDGVATGKAGARSKRAGPAVNASPVAEPKSRRVSKATVAADDTGQVHDLERLAEDLRRELEAAHMRIIELERQQTEVLNRIDWVLDTLKSVMAPPDSPSRRRRSPP